MLLALLAALSTPAIGQVFYRWVDDQGRVHYSDQPATDRPVEMIGTPKPAKQPAQPDSKSQAQSDSKSPAQTNSKSQAQSNSKSQAQSNPKSSAQSNSKAQSDSKAEELEAPTPESEKKASAKECADRRQQLAYLEKRAVAKPVDDPERTKSRELDTNYRQNLAVYESAKATRDMHAEFIAQNCSE